jgi:hypothetical protein
VNWPPKIGEPFPRAQDAWYEWIKFEDWIFSNKGHGSEWARVFHVGLDDWRLVWNTILKATASATIEEVRDRSPFGFSCGTWVQLTLTGRKSLVKVSWHYLEEGAAPRLVTAYPTP